jgi:hypothetical protein
MPAAHLMTGTLSDFTSREPREPVWTLASFTLKLAVVFKLSAIQFVPSVRRQIFLYQRSGKFAPRYTKAGHDRNQQSKKDERHTKKVHRGMRKAWDQEFLARLK